MAKKQVKNHPLDIKNHIGNDLVFLYLQLIGYPEPEPGEIKTMDIMNFRFQNLNAEQILNMLILMEEDGALKIEKVKDENYSIIKISQNTIDFIQSALDLYISRFIHGELTPFRKEPYKFKKQKKIFLEKIEERIEDSQSILSFSDADFDERFCFFPCLLAMEKQREIEIVSFYNERKSAAQAFYHIAFRVKDKQLQELGVKKEKENHSLKCFTRGGIGYFQIKKNTQEKEIGPENSRHYMLLHYLWRKGVDEQVNFKQAYNKIKDGKGYGSKKYVEDKELRVLENAQGALQKDGRIKPYRVAMSSGNRKIWLEHI